MIRRLYHIRADYMSEDNSEKWVQDCKRLLDQIEKLEETKGRDRLDIVRTISFTLSALQRSVSGWIEWANNPDVMANFSLKELKEISKSLINLTQPFIEYDCELTSQAQENFMIEEPDTQSKSIKKVKDKKEKFYIK